MIPAKEIDGELWIRAFDHHQAIKQVLTQPEPEPVAWLTEERYAQLHTSPPKRKPLTDDELKPLIQQAMMYYGYKQENWIHTSGAGFYQLARAIEAAHGIKGEA